MAAKTVADVMKMVKENEVKFVDFRFTDTRYVQFRSEFFNAFNNVDFSNPSASLCGGNCGEGTITSTSNIARQIQFALKLYF